MSESAGQTPMSLRQWLLQRKDFFPIIGPISGSLIVALVTFAVAIVVTQRLTTATKRTEFFLEFTKRYQDIHSEGRNLDREIQLAGGARPNIVNEGDAEHLYAQLFGLLYDEFYAYRHNFLEPQVYVEWMTWQWHDARGLKLAGVSYADALAKWFAQSAVKSHPTTPIVRDIFNCATEACVRSKVLSYAPPWWRFW